MLIIREMHIKYEVLFWNSWNGRSSKTSKTHSLHKTRGMGHKTNKIMIFARKIDTTQNLMSNKLDAERQIPYVFSHIHTSIHMHMYDIWVTLEQKGGQRREEARERRKGEWAQKKEECCTWFKVHDTSERNYLRYTQYWVFVNKGKSPE